MRLSVIGLVVLLSCSDCLNPLQNLVADQRFRLASRAPTGQLLMVDIDEPSIKAVGVWPWSRATHAGIVDALRTLGASDIAFDVDFSSPATPAGDAAFEAALERASGMVTLAAFQQVAQGQSDRAELVASEPLARFAAHAWEASVDVWPDGDGRIRWFSRGERFGSDAVPSLATLLGGGEQTTGRFLIDFGIDARRIFHVSVADLLEGRVAPALVRGRKVVVGASAVELRDFFEVPRFGLMAGAAVQALAVETLLQGRALTPVGRPLTQLLTALLLGIMAFAARRLSLLPFLILGLVSATLIEGVALLIQAASPVVLVTAPVHVGLIVFALVAVAEEIIQRRLKLLASRRKANRLRVMLDRVVADNFAGIVIVDQTGLVRASSEAATTLLGMGDAVARPFRAVLPPPLADLMAGAMAHIQAGATEPASTCERTVDLPGRPGALLDCVTTVSRIPTSETGRDAGREYAICLTFRDVTEERRAQARIAEMARIDALSGLANRPVFLSGVEERRQRRDPRTTAVVLFDVDRFKLINDRLGHATGDAMIQAVAGRAREVVLGDDLLARLGGDEFALIVGRNTIGEVEALLDTLRRDLGGPYRLGLFQPSISISIGAVICEGQGTTELMSAADTALYAAKAAGGDCVRFYDAAMKAADAEGKQIAQDLRIALERREFEVFYQRQVDAVSERIVGVEALVRWKHPERGYISPAKFIPVAERTGLIEPIGAWVLETACRDALQWSIPIKVSVNLSAVQLARATLADYILGTLAKTGLPPGRLDLELTESLLMDNDDPIKETLTRLRGAGIKISLDDFGTGYSSLSYLNTFSIDKIKIDQSFVRGLVDGSSAASIIRAVVSLARDLGLRVNVEGVETTEALRLVQALGCDEIQGYVHGRPEPARAIEASLLAQRGLVFQQATAA